MSKKKPIFRSGIKRARQKAGYKTQQEFANTFSVSLNTVQKWEQGKTSPTLGEFQDLCDFFSCDADYLLGRIDEKTHDLNFVCEYTGLSADAVEKLHSVYFVSQSKDFISRLIEQYGGDFHDLYSYIGSAVDSHIIANDSSNGGNIDAQISNHLKTLGVLTKDASAAQGVEIIAAGQALDFKLSEAARVFREFAKSFVAAEADKEEKHAE